MAANENVFNFDVSPFLAGVNKIGAGMDRIEGNAKKFGSTITGAVNKSVNGLILKVGGLIAAFKTAGAVLKEMPEVGQAFGLAKDIFLKNLLWPLRQQVMPLLQKMLDWVRDNRAQFVKWGATVANIFRTVVVVAKILWEVFKSLVKTVGEAFQKAFNTNFKSFDEFLNVLSFKISAVIIFMGMLAKQLVTDFKPAFEWIIDMGKTIIDFFVNLGKEWLNTNNQGHSLMTIMDHLKETFRILGTFIENAVKGFSEGFVPAMRDAMTPIDNIVISLNSLMRVLGMDDSDGVRGAFKSLGTFLGGAFMIALSAISSVIDELASGMAMLITSAGAIGKLFSGDFAGAAKEFSKVKDQYMALGARQSENFNAAFGAFDTSKAEKIAAYRKEIEDLKQYVKAHPNDREAQKKLYSAQTTLAQAGVSIDDGIVTKDGRVIHTSPDDNIFAAKDFSGYGKNKMQGQTINIGPFHISVTEGNAEQAGRNFGSGLAYSFRNNVSNARLAEGR